MRRSPTSHHRRLGCGILTLLGSPIFLEFLPHHLRQHPLHGREDAVIPEKLVCDLAVVLLTLDDDVGQDVPEVAHGELAFRVVQRLGGQGLVLEELAPDGGDVADHVRFGQVP